LRWPATLLIESASFRLGGLIFDSGPWLIAGLGGLALSILLWFPLVRGMTRSVSGMRRATGRIAEGQFDVRIAETRHDELGDLARSIDRMAEQLDWRTGASWIAPWGT
jgi:two-component system sensor histidine kinase CpxA